MINLVHESDPILKTEPSPWDFKNSLGIIRRLDIENDTWYKSGEVVSDTLDIQDKLKASDLYDMLIQHMVYHKGIGLSANQIGIPFKVFSMMVDDRDVICCFNPKIIKESEETIILFMRLQPIATNSARSTREYLAILRRFFFFCQLQ